MNVEEVLVPNVRVGSTPLVVPHRASLVAKEAYHQMELPSVVPALRGCIQLPLRALVNHVNPLSTVHKGLGCRAVREPTPPPNKAIA